MARRFLEKHVPADVLADARASAAAPAAAPASDDGPLVGPPSLISTDEPVADPRPR